MYLLTIVLPEPRHSCLLINFFARITFYDFTTVETNGGETGLAARWRRPLYSFEGLFFEVVLTTVLKPMSTPPSTIITRLQNIFRINYNIKLF